MTFSEPRVLGARPLTVALGSSTFERSTPRGSVPKQLLMKIEHREPMLIQEVFSIDGSSSERRQTFTVEIGAETLNPRPRGGGANRPRWEGSEL
jgi:hypothetical protein